MLKRERVRERESDVSDKLIMLDYVRERVRERGRVTSVINLLC